MFEEGLDGESQQGGQAELPGTSLGEAIPVDTGPAEVTRADTRPARATAAGVDPAEATPPAWSLPAEVAEREWVEREPGIFVEAGNAVWDQHDWTQVPIVPHSDEPPAEWLEALEEEWRSAPTNPELGPIGWLEEVPASGYLMNELENLPAGIVHNDYDALELVAHWSRLVSYAGAKMREAVAELASSEHLDQALGNLQHLNIKVNDPSIAGDELALRLGLGKRAASRLVRSAKLLTGPAGPTAEALETGQIDPSKADIIALGIEDLGLEEALQVQDLVLPKASHTTATAIRRAIATARATVLPERFEQRCQRAAAQRRVDPPRVLPDGMASIYALMPAVDATQVYRALDAAARSAKTSGDERTLDQLRSDALALMGATATLTGMIGPCPHPAHDTTPQSDAGEQAETNRSTGRAADPPDLPANRPRSGPATRTGPPDPTTGSAPAAKQQRPLEPPGHTGATTATAATTTGAATRAGADPAMRTAAGASIGTYPTPGQRMRVGDIGGKSAHVRVVIPLTSLMGGPGGPAADLPGSDQPATLDGYGPIPASIARALAAGGPWARMVTDPVDRTVLEVSSEKYRPTVAMAELVRAAQPECVRPDCTISSDSCDLHHHVPWPLGATTVINLDPGCRRDHLLLTHAGWTYTHNPDGSYTWTTATNHTYLQHPDGQITMIRPSYGPGASSEVSDLAASQSTANRQPSGGWAPAQRYTTDDAPPPF
ncbi:HNH endonuclease signature motif containing protein [Pseudactinotalea terrae]|uniref:HNH endonuclease signature motif containing protein n=1 Tax=Pseudactinotalea terrae TaxID=1743262 RepID=UPI0012E27809|nr:HNH endonuclease signature motif containing protein [Pseudactinotalea terrae]